MIQLELSHIDYTKGLISVFYLYRFVQLFLPSFFFAPDIYFIYNGIFRFWKFESLKIFEIIVITSYNMTKVEPSHINYTKRLISVFYLYRFVQFLLSSFFAPDIYFIYNGIFLFWIVVRLDWIFENIWNYCVFYLYLSFRFVQLFLLSSFFSVPDIISYIMAFFDFE